MQEKQNRRQMEKEEERAYACQTLDLVETRASLETDFSSRKNVKEINVIKENLQLNEEKRQRVEREKAERMEEERARVQMLNERGRNQAHPK